MKNNKFEKFLDTNGAKEKFEKCSAEIDTKKINELDSMLVKLLNKDDASIREKCEKEREDRRRFNKLGPKEYLIEKVLEVYPNLDRATLEKKTYNEIKEDLVSGVYLYSSGSN